MNAKGASTCILKSDDICKSFEFSKQRLSQYVKDGLPRHGPNTYDLKVVIAWFRARWEGNTAAGRPLDLARQREAEARTEKHLLELETLRGSLVRAEEAQAVLGQLVTWVAAELESIPGRVQAEPRIRAAITQETREAASRIAARLSQSAESLRGGGGPVEVDDAPAPPKRRAVGG